MDASPFCTQEKCLTRAIQTTTAYRLESGTGFTLAVLYFVYQRMEFQHGLLKSFKKPVEQGFRVFFDAAIYFALAIELASIVALVRKDFNINTDDFGAFEAQISWAVSVVCILPLLYPVAMLRNNKTEEAEAEKEDSRMLEGSRERKKKRKKKQTEKETRHQFRVSMLYLVTLLFFYPFVSQCIHNWAPTQIGTGNGEGGSTIISDQEWGVLRTLCFGDNAPLSVTEGTVLAAFEMAASLVMFLFAAWASVGVFPGVDSLVQSLVRRKRVARVLDVMRGNVSPGLRSTAALVFLLAPLLLAVPLLWGIERLRGVQRNLAEATNNVYVDHDWGFGQIVAIVLFAPVVFEMAYCWWEAGRLSSRGDNSPTLP